MKYQCDKNYKHVTESDKPICMCPVDGCGGEVIKAPGHTPRSKVVDGALRLRMLESY